VYTDIAVIMVYLLPFELISPLPKVTLSDVTSNSFYTEFWVSVEKENFERKEGELA
jgi:hypothetical protein